MGCFNQCCGYIDPSTGLELSVCELVLLDAYVDEATLGFDLTCHIGMDDRYDTADIFCLACDLGCKACLDTYANMQGWRDESNGYGYLRPDLTAIANRDAQNRLSDVVVCNDEEGIRATLFTGRIILERAACYHNHQSYACWGNEYGHPCHCFHQPGPDCDEHGLIIGSALPGFLRDRFFYERNGWPMREVTFQGEPNIYCRKWTDGARQTPAGPMGTVEVRHVVTDSGHVPGQTQFMAFHRSYIVESDPRCNVDAIVQCEGFVPGASSCSIGATPPGPLPCDTDYECDCTVRRAGEPVRQRYCQFIGSAECGHFTYLRILDWAPRFVVNDPVDVMKNAILEHIGTAALNGGPLDSIEHRAGLDGNDGLNLYRWDYEAASIDEASHIMDLDAHILWGGCPVVAELVLRRARIMADVRAHKKGHVEIAPIRLPKFIGAYVSMVIEVELGVRASLEQPCELAGEPLALSYDGPRWFPSVVGGPSGNRIRYATDVPVDIPLGFLWHGRRNQHSTPAVEYQEYDPPGQLFATRCPNLASKLGTFRVPALAGDHGADDPFNDYAGHIDFSFVGDP